jgi:S-adenosylmethionine synthetase
MVTGYATAETPEKLPETVSLARQVAKRLHEKRELDPEWFWLGPDAEVAVIAEGARPSRVVLTIEHGNESLENVRARVASEFREAANHLPISVNMTGACEKRGLARVSGASGRGASVYGSLIPVLPSLIGLDIQCVEKAGSWLARRAALSLLRRGAVAPLVQAVYLPGDFKPAYIKARDAHGRDLSAEVVLAELSLDRVRKEWWRSGLNLDAARWGFAGEPGLPWEE